MSKAEKIVGVRYKDMNAEQKKIYQNVMKKESRMKNQERTAELNKKYYDK